MLNVHSQYTVATVYSVPMYHPPVVHGTGCDAGHTQLHCWLHPRSGHGVKMCTGDGVGCTLASGGV